jgi:2-amino-4-hydroxy-6-hydroxymethyldihydropteridine diphosphokinase
LKSNIFLGLGSNIDDRVKHLNTATSLIGSCADINIVKSSLIYETEPWGIRNQKSFLNQVLKIQCSLSAPDLLTFVKDVEIKTGRTERARWHEREIDIDVLFYDNIIISTEKYKLPHGEIQNRKFVLIPMCEIASDFLHPVLNKSMKQLLDETKDISEVKTYN